MISSPTSRRSSRAAARYTAGCGLKAPTRSTEITPPKSKRIRLAVRCSRNGASPLERAHQLEARLQPLQVGAALGEGAEFLPGGQVGVGLGRGRRQPMGARHVAEGAAHRLQVSRRGPAASGCPGTARSAAGSEAAARTPRRPRHPAHAGTLPARAANCRPGRARYRTGRRQSRGTRAAIPWWPQLYHAPHARRLAPASNATFGCSRPRCHSSAIRSKCPS